METFERPGKSKPVTLITFAQEIVLSQIFFFPIRSQLTFVPALLCCQDLFMRSRVLAKIFSRDPFSSLLACLYEYKANGSLYLFPFVTFTYK